MKKSTIIAVLVAILSIGWIASGIFGSEDKANNSAAVKQEAQTENASLVDVRFKVFEAQPHINDVVLTGITEASRHVTLRAEVEGRVNTVPEQKGILVKEGDVLIALDEKDKKERLREAQERVKQRDIEFKAASSLAAKGFNSKVRLAQSKADLEEARAALKLYQQDLDNTKIKAPFDSFIFDTSVEDGDFARVGDALIDLVDLDPIVVRGYVTENSISEIQLENTARIVFINDTLLEGKISYIAPAADPNTRTFAIEITLDNPDGKIVEGMTVQIFIPTGEKQLHRISPSILSLNDEGQIGVKTLTDENKIKFMPIKILSDLTDHMLIKGLPEKVRIVTVGQDFVIEGQIVNPVESKGDGLL